MTRRLSPGSLSLPLAVAALAWSMAALWPRGDLVAWPAVSAGLLALGLSFRRGPAVRRALASILGLAAAGCGAAQIAVLWAGTHVLGASYM